jgi:hypothetical protein
MPSIFDTVSSHRKTLSGFAGLRDRALYMRLLDEGKGEWGYRTRRGQLAGEFFEASSNCARYCCQTAAQV